jgi:2-dehydro-3-deoxyphosphogluconate aldolase / (4S)-4-hydroxy-2-oxoglutarate aldolase
MDTTAERLKQARVVAIFRGDYNNRWEMYAQGLATAGITAMEITLNSAGALDGIRQIKALLKDQVVIGAGTVLTADQAHQAIDAGAEFIVAPDTDEAVIAVCRKRGIAACPGAYTPTEIKRAYNLGATLVKVFPAADPTYIKAVLAPLDFVPVMVTGGVTVDNIADFFKAGAVAVGVGSSLVKPNLTEREIVERAQAFADAVKVLA